MRRLLLIAGALPAVLTVAAPGLHAQVPRRLSHNQIFHRSTEAGQELRVFTYAQYHHDCRPDDPPRIELRVPAAHGSVTMRPRPSTVDAVREGGYDCSGHTYAGVAVFYLPTPGYRGTDRFEWDVVGRDHTAHDSAIVEVRWVRRS